MNLDHMKTREFWRERAPQFHIEDGAWANSLPAFAIASDVSSNVAHLLKTEGYVQFNGIDWGLNLSTMADAVRALSEQKLSPVFAFLYDEFWIPFFRLHHIYTGLLGGNYYLLPDFWVWNVDPRKGDSGWRPHRDKGHGNSLMQDGSPKSLTTWIPLSRATTLNGCMYIVPAHLDPLYAKAEQSSHQFEFSSIRALPAEPGDFFIWNQEVLHWGSRSSPRAPESRVSMAFEFQRADIAPFNQPLMPPMQLFTFDSRLRLVAKQILQYQHMYALEPELARMAQDIVSTPAAA
jgi:hypothetical protein